ncbi:hypothetical protein IGI04_002446 [Brassica rapa subsp. trilocularis]|uniref:No apical meristem-associated C-terminal domain-containing protein n=1 Tax=Brassica rapa subsp. trilocularis TaxID=1813537 RepID=A0ABQ7NVM2_BRACM|nr:hypothetical protein IGI04_002446 [Brassica rapa subsp. trilocularis]
MNSFDLNMNSEEATSNLSSRPMGSKKAKRKLQSEEQIKQMMEQNDKLIKAIIKGTFERNEIQRQKVEVAKKKEENKILFADLSSITDQTSRAYIENERKRILKKREKQINLKNMEKALSISIKDQYRASQAQREQVQGEDQISPNDPEKRTVSVEEESHVLGKKRRYREKSSGSERVSSHSKRHKPSPDARSSMSCASPWDLGAPSPSPIRPLVPPAVEEQINLRIYGKELKRGNITRIVYGWWYDDDIDERYADSASFDANEVDVSKMLLAKCKKQSRLKADIAQWEDCQLLSSGAVRGTQLQAGFSREEEEEERVVLLVHDAKLPPFLDNGKAVFTKQVEPVKDPTSDMAIVSRKGSGLVREIWEKQGLHKSRQRFWKLAGSNLGVEKPAEIDADTAVVGKKGEVDFRGEGKFAEHIKKKEKL